jgi:hypothetical protein
MSMVVQDRSRTDGNETPSGSVSSPSATEVALLDEATTYPTNGSVPVKPVT